MGIGAIMNVHAAFSTVGGAGATGNNGNRSGRREQFGPVQGACGFIGFDELAAAPVTLAFTMWT